MIPAQSPRNVRGNEGKANEGNEGKANEGNEGKEGRAKRGWRRRFFA